MEEIFKQSFEYANIRLFKNYTNILSKEPPIEEISVEDLLDEEDEPFNFKKITVAPKTRAQSKYFSNFLVLFEKGKKRSKYFYTTTPIDSYRDYTKSGEVKIPIDRVLLINAKQPKNGDYKEYFETTDHNKIKRHYGNPFASVDIRKIERWIKKDGDKITIKLFSLRKTRDVNDLYFKKLIISTTITFDMKKGNFNMISYNSHDKIKHKTFYRNSYFSLKTSIEKLYRPESQMEHSSSFFPDFMIEFNQYNFQLAIKSALEFDDIILYHDHQLNNKIIDDFCDRWINKFAEIKKIKCPDNNKLILLKHFYPTERYLKKNNRKLVSAVLDRFNAKSKITIKILHLHPFTSMKDLIYLCRIFGKDYPKYLGNIHQGFFYDNNTDVSYKQHLLDTDEPRFRQTFDNEKENVIKIINDTVCENNKHRAHEIITSIIDHFDMLEKTYPYYPDIRLSSRTAKTFLEDHINLSRLASQIRTGYSIELIFDEEVIQSIEKPFQISYLPPISPYTPVGKSPYPVIRDFDGIYEKTFYPKLLRRSEEYFEEGSYMHHCVDGYINSSHRSIIISLRCGNDRVTCEFDIRSKECQQSRYFTNDPPPEYFEKALISLKDRIRRIPYQIAPKDKVKIPLMVNGVEIKTKEIEELF